MPSILHTLRITQNTILVLLLLCLSLILQAEEKGKWIKDLKTGCAVWNSYPGPNDTVTWSGGCVGGKATGKGVLQWYQEGKPGSHYEGEYKDGKLHGNGVYTWADGDRYEGEFKEGKKHGRGVYTWAHGRRYEGEFKDGELDGNGVYTGAEGTRLTMDSQRVESLKKHADRGDYMSALLVALYYDQCEHWPESIKDDCLEGKSWDSPKNFELAAHYYRIAAEYGIPLAQQNLGRMYAAGDYLPQDYVEAAVWIALAFEMLPTFDAEHDWLYIEREQLLKKLTPVQIREVKRRVRNWRPKRP